MFRGVALAGAAAVLAACGGGGGGSSGSPLVPNPSNPLSLTFTADRTVLPLNLEREPAAIGSPFTATVNVRGSFVPGGGSQGGNCWTAEFVIISGHASGELAFPEGVSLDPTNAFQVSLSANWNVLVNATDRVGTVTLEVAVPNPDTAVVTCDDDKVEVGARFAGTPITYIRKQFQIQVGGPSSGTPSQVVLNRQAPEFLFVQGLNQATQLVVQARVVDEAGQPVPDPAPGQTNLFARIVPDPTSAVDDQAMLRFGTTTSKSVVANTINGQAQFAIISGNSPGTLMVEVSADRADNNVGNGVVELVTNAVAVPVVVTVAEQPLAIVTESQLPEASEGVPYAALLGAEGGVPPYSWQLTTGSRLPGGLSLASTGVITGTPVEPGEGFRFVAQVTDSSDPFAATQMREFAIDVAAAPPPPEPPTPVLQVATTTLPNGTLNQAYIALLAASGGVSPYNWSAVSLPPGLTVNSDGVISGVPAQAGSFNAAFTVRDADGNVANRIIGITINP
ncbi:MAG TPA: Ig domain-containing protein [Azoarcus taiwanensis]|nr:Ig domain-containing protein [Azoarcus taiwanensis]